MEEIKCVICGKIERLDFSDENYVCSDCSTVEKFKEYYGELSYKVSEAVWGDDR